MVNRGRGFDRNGQGKGVKKELEVLRWRTRIKDGARPFQINVKIPQRKPFEKHHGHVSNSECVSQCYIFDPSGDREKARVSRQRGT